MPLPMMATSSATLALFRMLGGTIGISIGDAILTSELSRRLSKISGFDSPTGSKLTNNFKALSQIQVSGVINTFDSYIDI